MLLTEIISLTDDGTGNVATLPLAATLVEELRSFIEEWTQSSVPLFSIACRKYIFEQIALFFIQYARVVSIDDLEDTVKDPMDYTGDATISEKNRMLQTFAIAGESAARGFKDDRFTDRERKLLMELRAVADMVRCNGNPLPASRSRVRFAAFSVLIAAITSLTAGP